LMLLKIMFILEVQTHLRMKKKKAEVEQSTQSESTQSQSKSSGGKILASPIAKKLASEKGIDLSNITGTGPGNRIIKADVLEYNLLKRKLSNNLLLTLKQ